MLVNAFAVAMLPSQKTTGLKVLRTNAAIMTARHALYNALLTPGVEAIIAFGDPRRHRRLRFVAASNPAVDAVPSSRSTTRPRSTGLTRANDRALKAWDLAVKQLRGVVTPDPGGDASGPRYGTYFIETDYARIPRWDLPSAAPLYAGDDSWGRGSTPARHNCCARPSPDDRVGLLLTPPVGAGKFLRYDYKAGKLIGARTKSGKKVAVDAFGIPV